MRVLLIPAHRLHGLGRQDSLAVHRTVSAVGPAVASSDQAQAAAAPRTGEHVEPKRPAHQVRPEPVPRVAPSPVRRLRGRFSLAKPRTRGRGHPCVTSFLRRRVSNHRGPPGRAGRQDAVVQHQVDPRPRHEHRQPSQKVEGIPLHVRRAIDPPVPELQPHPPVAGDAPSFSRHGRTQRIATHALEPLPLLGRPRVVPTGIVAIAKAPPIEHAPDRRLHCGAPPPRPDP